MGKWSTHQRFECCEVIQEIDDKALSERSLVEHLQDKALGALRRSFNSCHTCGSASSEDDLSKPRGSFEDQAARAAVKFEVCFTLIETLTMVIFLVARQGRSWPIDSLHLWPAAFFSITVRVGMALARSCVTMQPRYAQAACFIIDGLLVVSCHSSLAHKIWYDTDFPVEPNFWGLRGFSVHSIVNLTAAGAENFVEWTQSELEEWTTHYHAYEADLNDLSARMQEEQTMVHYTLNVLVWFHCTFILSFKYAIVLVPSIIAIYFTVHGVALAAPETEVRTMNSEGCFDTALLLFSAAVAVTSKGKLEKAQRFEFELSETKRQEMIQERVRRYEAEFAKERVGGAASLMWSVGRPPVEPSLAETQVTSTTSYVSRAAASVRSAPATMHTGAVMKHMRRSGECLPPDAVVWVEGQAMPRPTCTVCAGDRVLCYDSLSLVPKFVEVLACDTIVGEAAWVVVKLADGTSVTLTADHPTQPQRPLEDLPLSNHVPAVDLRAGSDRLMVLKIQPVAVKSVLPVQHHTDGASVHRRVALTLQQPERHEVFVAPCGGVPGQDMATIAVGSADIAAPPRKGGAAGDKALGITVKRTFIDVEDGSSSNGGRCSSCPPRLGVRSAPTRPGVTWAPSTKDGTAAHPLVRLRRVGSESDVTSISSRQSSAPTDVDVLVAVTSGAGAATVGEMLQVRRGGFPSRGSCGHELGTCQVCLFENRHQHGDGPPCFKGALCDHCHLPHELVGRRKRVPASTRNFRKWQARTSQGETEMVCQVVKDSDDRGSGWKL
mmetsp:Transcript_27026/g.62436  ORF Transcript_27026/g.62436 Transcript_27026/m.62436 type:complete len:777 (-) Transcript_27026:191-2521(-)